MSSAELYKPDLNQFVVTGSMTTQRCYATAVLLADGRVLVTGGIDTTGGQCPIPVSYAGNNGVTSAEIYNPATGTFTATGSMNFPRAGHTATLLRDGRVLIAGGVVCGGTDIAQNCAAELYDPKSGTFTLLATAIPNSPYFNTATLLSNGKVLFAGGRRYGAHGLKL